MTEKLDFRDLSEGYDELPLDSVDPIEAEHIKRLASIRTARAFVEHAMQDSHSTLGEKAQAQLHLQQSLVGLAAFEQFHDLTRHDQED